MTQFSVWAPAATRVDLELGGTRIAMAATGGGWFQVEVPAAGDGTDYSFVLDGDGPLPDPRSRSQPYGVHGPSRYVDHSRFPWTDQTWTGGHLGAAVFYEVHVSTFTPEGTFAAAISRLDHLVDLGVSVVELMPVAEFAGRRGWGYDGVDLYAPHHDYGGPDGLRQFVDACHTRSLQVVLDVVYNHLGPAGNYLSRFGPYFTERYATPWGPAVNFDGPGSDDVRAFTVDNALMWLRDYHCDGLRIDAVHAIVDTSATHILEELAARVEELSRHLGRHLFLVAESDLNDPRVVRRREEGGYGIDAQWSDDFHHALHVALTGEQSGYYEDFTGLADLAAAYRDVFVFAGRHSTHRRRRHGRLPVGVDPSRFVVYMQNHDQVGNRPRGERSSFLMSPARLKIAAALVLTSPYLPLLFQGEEWGASTPFLFFADHDDPALAAAVAEGRRREFAASGWKPDQVPDPADADTMAASVLDWEECQRPPHDDILDWHRRLIRLRRTHPALASGQRGLLTVTVDPEASWIRVQRGAVTVAANLGMAAVTFPAQGRLLLASGAKAASGGVTLGGDSVAVWG